MQSLNLFFNSFLLSKCLDASKNEKPCFLAEQIFKQLFSSQAARAVTSQRGNTSEFPCAG